MSDPVATTRTLDQGSGGTAPQLESELRVLFRRARELFRTTAADVHPELNVTGYATLMRVVEDGPLRASALVCYFGTDKGSMSRQLAQLEKLGLVRRTRDPDDGRAQVVSATPDALRRTGAARARSRARLRQRISGWEPTRLETLTALLHEFNVALTPDPH
jgi:DNA-binding MarR family transcriptional regulator